MNEKKTGSKSKSLFLSGLKQQKIVCEKNEIPGSVKEEAHQLVVKDQPGPDDLSAVPMTLLQSECLKEYDLIEKVGSGGMGVVYKAKHKVLDKTVALKMLHKELAADPVNVRRFQIEVKAASSLTHPNLAAVYDSGVADDGAPYLVMDYLRGVGLDVILKKEGFLEQDRFFNIFTQVCDALIHAHGKLIIHRDLKPSNIMIVEREGDQEHVKLVDFGIARVLQRAMKEGSRLTQTGEVIGSPIYMSPEQCLGLDPDERSDIYSLGVVMYEALAGVPPFQGENSIQVIVSHINKRPRSINQLRPDLKVSSELEDLVMKALEKEPDNRFQSMIDLAKQLDKAREKPRRSWFKFGSNPIVKRLREPSQSAMRGAFLKGFAAASIAGLIALAYFLSHRTPVPSEQVPAATNIVETTESDSFQYDLDQAQLAILRGDGDRAAEFYQKAIDAARRSKFTDQKIYELCVQAADDLMIKLGVDMYSAKGNEQINERNNVLFLAEPFYEQAIALCKSGVDSADAQSELLSYLAEIQHLKKDYVSEERSLRASIEKADSGDEVGKARCACAFMRLAGLYKSQHRYGEAEKALKNAIRDDPESYYFDAKSLLADLYSKQGKYRMALPLYRELVGKATKEDFKGRLLVLLPKLEKTFHLLGKNREATTIESQLNQLKTSEPDLVSATKELAQKEDWGHFFEDDQDYPS